MEGLGRLVSRNVPLLRCLDQLPETSFFGVGCHVGDITSDGLQRIWFNREVACQNCAFVIRSQKLFDIYVHSRDILLADNRHLYEPKYQGGSDLGYRISVLVASRPTQSKQ